MAGGGADGSSKMTRSVADGIPTQSVGTSTRETGTIR